MSQSIKDALLGQSFGAASNRLRKLILWSLVQETGKDACFRCGQRIEDVDDLSIEHKAPWQSAPDPKASFFDLGNIAFSHLSCNSGSGGGKANAAKTHCPVGHPYDDLNTKQSPHSGRICRTCRRQNKQRTRSSGV